MKQLVLTGAILLASLVSADAKNLVVKSGDRVFVEYIRNRCDEGGMPPNAAVIKSWLAKPLKHGRLEIAAPGMHRSNSCGKKMWMRKVYYRATSKGTETINIQFPRNGLTIWQVQVR